MNLDSRTRRAARVERVRMGGSYQCVPKKGMRSCTVCQLSQQDICFSIFRYNKDHSRAYYCRMCRTCANGHAKLVGALKKEHPTPPEACECCGFTTKKLHADHCWKTGQWRGHICLNCNTALGKLSRGLEDDMQGLERAMDYLRKTQCRV
jgi:hypothetical protein